MSLSATPTLPEILDEVDETLPHTFPSTKTNWLYGGPPLVFPTSFANKTRIKLLDTQELSSPGTTVNFTGMDCGDTTTGRMLYAVIGLVGTSGSSHTVAAQPAINGVGATADAAWSTHTNGQTCIVSVAGLNDTTTLGLNGSAQLVTSGGTVTTAFCAFFAAYDTEQTSPTHRHSGSTGTSRVTTIANAVNVPARGQIMSAIMNRRTEDVSVTGVEKRHQFTVGTGSLVIGYDSLQSLNASKTISFSWATITNAVMSVHARAN